MGYNSQEKLRNNIAAVRIALEWEAGKTLSLQEQFALKQYSGFGGIKAMLFPEGPKEEWRQLNASQSDLKLYEDIMSFHRLLREKLGKDYYEAVQSLKNSVLTAFYTPAFIPRTIDETLNENGIHPERLYDPSSGAGVFATEARHVFPNLKEMVLVEKDILTGKILQALSSSFDVPNKVYTNGFEQTPSSENSGFDLVTSNIPFGNFSVYDPAYSDPALYSKIHNYFFAKGLDKLQDGGILAFITTDAFLNSPSNAAARNQVFERADFMSLNVLPDNLMKDTGNTEAPSHLLLLQKNESKSALSDKEKLLLETVEHENEWGKYHVNAFIPANTGCILGDTLQPDRNQYGQPHLRVWQNGPLEAIREDLARTLQKGLEQHYHKRALHIVKVGKRLTMLPMPTQKAAGPVTQLGLFETAPINALNRAMDYIREADAKVVDKKSARILNIVRVADQPQQECVVLVTARSLVVKPWVYKLYSNVEELQFPASWSSAAIIEQELGTLQKKIKGYPHDFYNEGDAAFQIAFQVNAQRAENILTVNPLYKEGTLLVQNDRVGFYSQLEESLPPIFLPARDHQQDLSFYRQYTAVRDGYLELVDKETKEQLEQPLLREEVNAAYEALVKGYGQLNSPTNRQRVLKDEAFGFSMLASLERKEGEQYSKADILVTSLVRLPEVFRTDEPLDALARSLNDRGKVDLLFIATALGETPESARELLVHHIYQHPVTKAWETADQFLGGNVVQKLAEARQEVSTPEIQVSIAALEKVQPEKIPFALLDFNLGERWMPLGYYERYARQLFELPVDLQYFSSGDAFKVTISGHNTKTDQEFAVVSKTGAKTYGYTLLEHALENTSPYYTYEVDTANGTVRRPDNDAIQLAHQKIESIRKQFPEWLERLPSEEKQEIEKLYNDTFNCYVLRQFDGSHLQFPGLDKKRLGIEDLYASQKDAAWRIIQNRGALIDHEVGLGKTLTMIVAAHEMKRLGIVHKPMILAMKANVNQIRDTYRKAYPNAKVLAPGEQDFTPAKRMRLSHEIKNNDWECIILTHDQFGKIPQSPEIQQQMIQTELTNLEKDLLTLKEMGGEMSRRMLKGLEIRKNNLGTQLQTIRRNIEEKKDAGLSFKDIGVDHLFVDESHKFKNLTFTTRHDRVAGLGNMQGSQKALNMLFAVRTLQEKFNSDLCVTFLSGTPISNSLTEMYLLFKYLRPNEMKRQQIENFDAWAAVFARKTVDFEFSVTNEIIAKERFRHFIKVPELALFYNEITDYKTAQHIRLDKPRLQEELIAIPPTPDQQQFIKQLMAFAKNGDATLIGRAALTKEEDRGRMLIATNYAKKMAADMRLIDPVKYEDHPHHKVNVCAKNVADIYSQSKEEKGTQIVFCDIGTPKPHQFNLYEALRQQLVANYHIPASQITFIHDWSDLNKPELFRKMNTGEIRILLGSTEKAGTGVNVQQKVIAMHHLDIPWKPSELEQRNGRGARQGNLLAKQSYNNTVKNYIYAVEQSLDNYKFNLLKNKQTFISQLKNNELQVRTLDEGAMDEKSGMNFAEYIAILSGDTSLLEKTKLEKKIAVLESLRSAHHKEMHRTQKQLENLQKEKQSTADTLQKLSMDSKRYQESLQFDKEGTKVNPLQLKECPSADPEVIGKYLIRLQQQWQPKAYGIDDEQLGTLYGFACGIRKQGAETQLYAASVNTEIKYTWNSGRVNTDNPKLAARYFLNAIDRVTSLHEKYSKTLKEIEQQIPALQQLINKPFEKTTELQELKTAHSNLEQEIVHKLQAQQLATPPVVEEISAEIADENPTPRKKKRGIKI